MSVAGRTNVLTRRDRGFPALRSLAIALAMLLSALVARPAHAQVLGPALPDAPLGAGVLAPGTVVGGQSNAWDQMSSGDLNPLSILAAAGRALPGQGDAADAGRPGGSSSEKPREQARGLSAALNVLIVLSVVALAPTILLMCTCFLRIVIVLSLLKQALGTAQMPPSQVLLGLSLVMTLLVMSPTIERINKEAVQPYRQGQVKGYDDLWERGKQPVRDFMFAQIEQTGNWSSLYMVLNYRGIDTSRPELLTRADVDMVSLVPAFVLSELKVAFLMGFRVYLPFLVIDMVISSLLISMSMMMLPPVLISLPFKLLLFVLVDGWQLVVGSLMSSFATGLPAAGVASLSPPIATALGMYG